MKKITLISFWILVSFTTASNALIAGKTVYCFQQAENVTATITKNTTDKQLEELKEYFETYEILLDVSEITRNKGSEITGLNLQISKKSQSSSYNMHSNTAITSLELGYKEGSVFVGKLNTSFDFGEENPLASLLNSLKQRKPQLDSLLSQNEFSFSFNNNDIRDFLGDSSLDLNKLQQQFFSQFVNPNGGKESNSHLFPVPNKSTSKNLPKYNFINSGTINKLIVVDGKESSFEELDALAKADKLAEVDNLKPSTAISLYGEKASDGAIIATTKK